MWPFLCVRETMADSINQMPVTTTKQNVFVETAITNTAGCYIENTGNSIIYFAEKATEPSTERGGTIRPLEQKFFDSGSSGIWLWTKVENTSAAIQES